MPPQADPLPPRRAAIHQLDTIRVLAMLAIFLHHLWKTVIPAPETSLQKVLNPIFLSASDGVIFFNFISGFLLALAYFSPGERSFDGYGRFIQKRFLRIVPPYFLALFIFTIANIIHFGVPPSAAIKTLIEHLLFINALDYSNMYSNIAHFWFLGMLAQFYLLFPFLLRFFQRTGPARAALLVVFLCWGSWLMLDWYYPENPDSPGMSQILMHFNLPGRLPEFAIGIWLASLWGGDASLLRQNVFRASFAPFFAAATLFFVIGSFFYSALSLPLVHIYNVAMCLIILIALLLWRPVARAGETAIMKDFAEQSYGVYIVHQTLFSYANVMPSTTTHTLSNFVLLILIFLPLSYLGARVLNRLTAPIMRT